MLPLFVRPLVPGPVPFPLVRPALIGLVVPVSHLAPLGLVLCLFSSWTTTVSFSFVFNSSMDLFLFLPMALTVISVNANGLRDEDRRLGFLQWLSHLSPSVVCLPEKNAVLSVDLQSWFSRFGFLCAGSFGSVHSRGVAVLYRPIFECRSVVCEFDGRFVPVEFAFRGAVFHVASIHAPNRNPDHDDFFVCCVNAVDPTVPTLLCSDFSTVLDRVVDHRGSCPFDVSRESSVMLSGLFLDCCVMDIWREHPGVSAFTWCRPDGALASRIDLIGCPYVWVPYVSSVDLLPCPFSDHCALSFSWTLSDSVPVGPGLLKLNLAILEEDEYVRKWFEPRSSIP